MMKAAVWIMRVLVGATFVFSGFAKAVDPWGFMYKIQEYLAVWDIAWMPREAIFCAAALMALIEFTAGAMLLLGCMRRGAVWTLLALMAGLLPLSVYIAIASPVEDCGCFGEALVISNTATLIKNIVITVLLLLLLKHNDKVPGAVKPIFQWLPALACAIYCLVLSVTGLAIQPIVDFRPYKVGESILPVDSDEEIGLIYKKGAEEKVFSMYNLPDSTWQYVGRQELSPKADKRTLAIYDADDEDVTEEVLTDEGPLLILSVPNPAYHTRARSSMANKLNSYIENLGGSMIGIVALRTESVDAWKELALPEYPLYTADATALKELARGDASLIYVEDGIIRWKRDAYSFPSDFPEIEDGDTSNQLAEVHAVEDGSILRWATIGLLLAIVAACLLGGNWPSRKGEKHIRE